MNKPSSPSTSGTSSGKPRSIHDAGSPDTKHGPKAGTNPDGATPAELPSAEAGKASLHKPAPPDLQSAKPRKTP
jgi:hypothetical protein